MLDLPMVRVTSPTTWDAVAKALKNANKAPTAKTFSKRAADMFGD
jgi:hypothetical protein